MIVPLCVPQLDGRDLEHVRMVLESGHLVQGQWVARLEGRLSELTSGRPVVATSSGTTALHLAFLRYGIGPGDDVLVSALTFPAPANIAELLGARVIPVDVDPDTCGMSLPALRAAITPRTRAIVVVHQYGIPVQVSELMDHVDPFLADGRRIVWIEDAACALGAHTDTGPCGTLLDVGCFSFHPRKIITTGEGGAIVATTEKEAAWYRRIRNHGQDTFAQEFADRFPVPGHNFRMSDVHAAIGVGQLDKITNFIAERAHLAATYRDLLSDIRGLYMPAGMFLAGTVVQSFVVVLPESTNRANVIKRLAQSGVEATTAGYAIPRLNYFVGKYGFSSDVCPQAGRFHDLGLTIPLFPGMSLAAQHHVAMQLRSAVSAERVD
ncbi:MAG: DegT/DnrJ/EryC1/StrS family aminotransferase [Myxococcales bacterium]|nr:DegT/DnrJ/EryC1/StrS family aminotransferase [Myxococcales bacterium]